MWHVHAMLLAALTLAFACAFDAADRTAAFAAAALAFDLASEALARITNFDSFGALPWAAFVAALASFRACLAALVFSSAIWRFSLAFSVASAAVALAFAAAFLASPALMPTFSLQSSSLPVCLYSSSAAVYLTFSSSYCFSYGAFSAALMDFHLAEAAFTVSVAFCPSVRHSVAKRKKAVNGFFGLPGGRFQASAAPVLL
mmetsp:Transcript_40250/g.90293  ORF Transcript_40250/g.90293 Transcript_40250/m.90293 type:complete len:201 (-) Transcript_40250:430-1032(-)